MTFVKPLCGTRYNPHKIQDLADVITWPYDCIAPQDQDQFYKRSEYNIIRLIMAKRSALDSGGDNPHTRAMADLMHWYESGVLVTDPAPAFYYYRLGYALPDGTTMLRKGFIGLMKISDYEEKRVLPHEQISERPVKDRLKLITATGANLSPIFVTYSDPERSVLSLPAGSLPADPIIKTTFIDNSEHTIWRITDKEICDAVSAAMKDKPVMIADGHHRYEAALRYREIGRKQFPDAGPDAPFEYILTYFSPMEDGGITILPTHRSVSGIKKFARDPFLLKLSKSFYIKEVPFDPDSPLQAVDTALAEAREMLDRDETFVMGLANADSLFLINFKKDMAKKSYDADVPQMVRSLDVAILQKIIFEKILGANDSAKSPKVEYFTNTAETFTRLQENAQIVFLLNPTKMETLWTCAKTGQLLPDKSTFFYPKVLAGFLIHKF